MFRVHSTETGKTHRLAIIGLLTFSAGAFAVTVWVMNDFLREQEMVQQFIEQLPGNSNIAAGELVGELRSQFRLSILIVLNLVVTALAVVLLWRAYRSSQESLWDIKGQAGDILNSMDQAVITTDLRGTVTSINRRAIELLTLKGEHVGKPLANLSDIIPLEQFRATARSNQQAGAVQDYPCPTNGSPQVLRAFCEPLQNHQREKIGNVVQLHDVTERVLMDARLLRMERYMGLGSLAVGLHHEIKNPLAALSLHVQLLDEEIVSLTAPAGVHEMLGVIKTEVIRIGEVLENFRDFASLYRLNLTDVDLEKLVDRQVKLISPQAEQQQIEVCVELPREPLAPVKADRVRLEQVLLNLFINAMEAMPEGGRLTVAVSMIEDHDARSVRIEVRDTGPGIADSMQDHIFDPYFTTKKEGTGMGLALCDKIMCQHDGRLEFHSSNNGAILKMILPITSGQSEESQEIH